MSELESGVNKQQFEASEFKVHILGDQGSSDFAYLIALFALCVGS